MIDKHVLSYLLDELSESSKHSHTTMKDTIVFNDKLLDEKRLYLCFKNTKDAKLAKDIFNKGIEKVNMRAFFNESLR